MPHSNKSKWTELALTHDLWDSPAARSMQRQEALCSAGWLQALQPQKIIQILELGCGNGYFGLTLINQLKQDNRVVRYHFTDFVPACLEKTKQLLKPHEEVRSCTKVSALDVYALDKAFPANSLPILVSTGFAAAASYKEVVPKVAKVLKPKGIFICDFVNHLSPFVWGVAPTITLKKGWELWHHRTSEKAYHWGPFGIASYFARYHLKLIHLKPIGWKINPFLALFIKT